MPPAQQREIADALREAGIRHEMVVHPGVGHGFLHAEPATAADVWRRVHTLLTSVEE
ncbi:dienelactone hydrolase family protein [Kitasatospora sp. NPDC127060]|uniref:dienelactone hydrolase family protein n=1 Tax=Kitasatospora sp. NPDC127060 TaxID=3347121 RepID=UPI00364701B2